MSRIESTFARLKEQQRKALIPFITAGDPGMEMTVPLMRALVSAGADIIELGMPFSDPMADGPVIQKACERALAAGTGLPDVLAMVREFRRDDDTTPVVLMGYLNPVECMGYERFAETCAEVGVDGVLLVDLPPEECDEVAPLFKERGVDLIFLVAPHHHGRAHKPHWRGRQRLPVLCVREGCYRLRVPQCGRGGGQG